MLKKDNDDDSGEQQSSREAKIENKSPKFSISSSGECQAANYFGYTSGRPCVLVKMNKVKPERTNDIYLCSFFLRVRVQLVGFTPKPGAQAEERDFYRKQCGHREKSVAIHCYGEVIEFIFVSN